MANPMQQFEIERIGPEILVAGQDLSFNNSALWMLISLLAISAFLFIGTAKPQLIPGRAQAAVEYLYDFIRDMLRENVGREGLKYAPLIFALFVFVLSCNLLGLVPFVHSFTPTSHIAVTFGLAIIVFALVLIVGFAKHGLHFFTLFLPEGTPLFVLPLVAVIEFLSFLSRPFTLAIRLFANMTAGHVLLKVFGGFVVALGSFEALPYVFGLVPLTVNVALTALELLIAVVQAYV
ncbi:F0F1 ATP synthase subunit A, partial [Polymorphobacter sp.]|uniref:F0F1 ATP synthase subunit A n=1 Tax=Polymorphobacter sp. TaxID=1909290 RepID=UPI003F72D7CA